MEEQVLVIGEALIDIVETADGTRELVGGSPANVAVGLARLGHRTALHTHIGRDARGARIAEHVASSRAGLTPGSWGDAPTSTARARLAADGSASYVFDIDWRIPAPVLGSVALVHSGSIALFLEPGGEVTLEALRHAAHGGALVSVDPNIRPALVGDHSDALRRFGDAARTADLVKLSDEDAAWLYPGRQPEEVLADIAAHGPRLVVMTRGAAGAMALGPDGIVAAAAWPVAVADTIGAGDAYMASLISSAVDDPLLFTSEPAVERAMRRAAVAAGITVARSGANPPTRAELDAALR